MATPPAELLAELPDDVRAAFVRLYPDAVETSAQSLGATIDSHLRETDTAARNNEFVDTTLSHTIAQRLRRVLEQWESLTQIQRAAVQATVAYYVLSEDVEDDLDSVIGFEDDAQVFNACVRFLARPQLQIVFE